VETNFQIKASGSYHLNDFMHLHDRAFVNAAYSAILRRSSDSAGAEYYVNRIRRGISRESVLVQMMQSAEAINLGTKIHGLSTHILAEKFLNVPFFGEMLSSLLFIFSAKTQLREIRALANHIHRINLQPLENPEHQRIGQPISNIELSYSTFLTPRAAEIYAQLKNLSINNNARTS
jgi:hypothetical protein